jgi:hypothetical protein
MMALEETPMVASEVSTVHYHKAALMLVTKEVQTLAQET